MNAKLLTRRSFITQFGTAFAGALTTRAALAQGAPISGSGDQTREIQRLINEATRRNRPAILPSGTFVVSNLTLPDGCDLRGTGAKTILRSSGNGPAISARDAFSVSLSALTVYAGRLNASVENTGAVDFRNVAAVDLTDIRILNSSSDGLYVERCGGTISGCSIQKAARFGIFAVESAGLTVADNTVSGCANGGIIVQRWSPAADGTRVLRNKIKTIGAGRGGTGQWGNGINVFQAHGVMVDKNAISGCAFSAIRMNSAHDTMITNNRCTDSGETAIYAEFAYRNVIITNNEIDGAANGISATNLNDGGRGALIQFNKIKNLTAPGPYKPEAPFFGHGISVEADGIVTDNIIENANGYGINIGWGPYLDNVDVARNLIVDAEIGIGVSVAEGAGRARITDNKIRARNGSIRTHQWDKIGMDDLITTSARLPRNILLERNLAL
ncbi:MAG: TIGR03808 family TAT-translocated repetitive protein [Ahrensia sp.]|nr:TIGR03808 family TAT-translocated repetitive protein [Ahrensia sp.]